MFGVKPPTSATPACEDALFSRIFSRHPPPEAEKCSDNPYRCITRISRKIPLNLWWIVVILVSTCPRTIRVRSSSGTVNEYVRVVEASREDGQVKPRVV